MVKSRLLIIIAVLASASAALADGDYFEGTQKTPSSPIDHVKTSGVSQNSESHVYSRYETPAKSSASLDRGDYYEGTSRPN